MRLAFISTLNLHVTPANCGEIVVFSHVKCAWASFRIKIYMSLPPTPEKSLCFSMKNPRCTKPPQIPCVFSSKTRLACNVPVNRVHFHCVVSGTLRLGFTSQCEFTCDAASPSRMPSLFPTEKAPRGNCREVSKLEQRHMLTKE